VTTPSRTRAFAIVAFAFVVAMAGTTLPTPLYPIYEQRFGFSGVTVTVIFATYAVGVIAALVLFGNLSDRIGRKRVLLPGLLAGALSAVCFLLADGLPLLLVGRFLSGLSAGIFTGTATATLIDLAPGGDRDRASLVATIANMGGLGLGPPLAGLFAEILPDPIRLVFLAHLVLLGVAALGLRAIAEPTDAHGPFAIRPRGFEVPPEVRVSFIRASVAGFAGFAVAGLFSAIAPAFLGQVLDVTNHLVIGLVVMCLFAGSIAGQVLRRRVDDRVALAGGCATLIAGMAILVTSLQLESVALMVLAAVVGGAGQGLSFAAGLALVAGGAPADRRAAVTSSLFVVTYVAISLPVVGVGLLADATDLVEAGTVFAGIVALLAAGAALSLVSSPRGQISRT